MLFRGLVHCALALAVAFAGIGALYLNLGAQFLGLAQLLVYVGAIAVLIVFVVLLTRGGDSDSQPLSPAPRQFTGILVAGAIFAILAWAIFHSFAVHTPGMPVPQASIRQLGAALMESYALPLEVIGLMLTAALIGAVLVAMKEKPGPQ
jgi:NADH-quinone oxidoreductase subunit J